MLSNKAGYAIRALMELARRRDTEPVLIAEVAKNEGIPKKFLELILLELRNKGYVYSKKGKGGGYALARSPEELKVGEVIRALEGRSREGRDVPEGLSVVLGEAKEAQDAVLDRVTIASLLRREEELEWQRKSVLMYSI